ncbi:alpha/beta fold hydrolase [Hoyosella rhizosphaerae]|uniref:Hydrolase n=1 Tax=Hoyosella rhizosphaerae TaxID=1755582 RepID=A0A916XDI5_9ACTN|nr:alpha/beta fold hydrolase [Hoyosella rhizosphaerae]MBN4927516.1 alpha/beta fold hydrolase [Hoyosella rhizosphaerae]GGC63872.1 hydrolase [Hoyosella rhizosphaerae]
MQLSYRVFGSGPTLILIHGIVHNQRAWDPVIPKLAKHRRVVTIDLPSHGESPQLPPADNVLQALADEVEEFLPFITPDGEDAHVAGNSLGGWLALELAARGAVASATALSPGGFFINELDQKRANATFLGLRAFARAAGPIGDLAMRHRISRSLALAVFFARPWRVDLADAERDMESLTTNTMIDIITDADWTLSTPVDPSLPVTVEWGAGDLILPVYQATKVRTVFPQARLIVLPWVGHVPMIDDPDEIAAILIEGSAGP